MKQIALTFFSLSIVCGYSDVLVDFNTAGDLSSKFTGPASGGVIDETSDNGLQNTRGVNLANAGFSQIEVYNQPFSGNLSSWQVGAYVSFLGNETRNVSFGLVNDTAAFVNGASHGEYVQPSGDWNSIGMSVNRLGNLSIYNNNNLLSSLNVGVLTQSYSWFYIQASGTSSGGLYSLSASIYQSDSFGNKGNLIGSPLTINGISNPALINDPTAYFFFGADQQTGGGSAYTLDNFQITIVPEPNTIPLVLLGASILAVCSTRTRSAKN